MPTTRSQGLTANEALENNKVPRTRKKKNDSGTKATKATKATKESQFHLQNSVAESTLFKLPPELRIMIYRFAIITDEAVVITESSGLQEPALLLVSKLVREESCKLFYCENRFSCVVEHYSLATMELTRRKNWCTDLKVGIRNFHVELHHTQRHWGNLVLWLHKCVQGKCGAWQPTPEDQLPAHVLKYSAEEKLVAGLFRFVALESTIMSKDLDLLLECMRPTLVAHNKDWAKD